MVLELLSSIWDLLFSFSSPPDGSFSTHAKGLSTASASTASARGHSQFRRSIHCIGRLDSRWIRHWIVQDIKHQVEAMNGLDHLFILIASLSWFWCCSWLATTSENRFYGMVGSLECKRQLTLGTAMNVTQPIARLDGKSKG